MARVELVYDGDCPNVAEARTQLLRAFARAKVEARWKEWRADDDRSPAHVRRYGSPTILVDGRDVAESEPTGGACCRLYTRPDGSMRGAPDLEPIVARLERGGAADAAREGGRSWKLHLAMIPGIGASLLPKVACPACWPAYAGLLSSVGLGFLVETAYLLPLTAAFLALAVLALAFRARQRRDYGPLLLGVAASVFVLAGKFWFGSDAAMYAGLVVLVAASLWSGWPRKQRETLCSSCARSDTQAGSHP